MKKLFYLPFILFWFLLFKLNFIDFALAQSPFSIDSFLVYELDQNGKAKVRQEINIKNKVPEVYAQSYNLDLFGFKIENATARDSDSLLPLDIKEEGDRTSLKVSFPDIKVGKGVVRSFSIFYEINSFAKKTGEVWEIYLPRQGNIEEFDSYNMRLEVPLSFGNLAYSSPEAKLSSTKEDRLTFDFDKDILLSKTGVSLGFGNFQIFSFVLNYHLENPLNKEVVAKIALPPDTHFQRVFYEMIEPRPKDILVDSDGNWLAEYNLSPRELLDIQAKGYVQIFPYPQDIYNFSSNSLFKNTLPQPYWESDDLEIKKIANSLKTVKDVYNYVVDTLNYDYERAKPNVQRLGAKKALSNPNSAICMEFTDLFIALLRAKGIPAREVNGFAYSEDPKLTPLSLVNDVLHSWPEYWDEKRKIWIPVDPTWQKTSHGSNFFEKQDLRHFTFVIHGESSTYPASAGSYKLGIEPQKDVFVTIGGKPDISYKTSSEIKIIAKIPFFFYQVRINIKNEGQSAVYNQKARIFFDKKLFKEEEIPTLLPFSSYEFYIGMPFSFLAKETPNKISVNFLSSLEEARGAKNEILLSNILIIFSIFIITISIIILNFNTRRLKTNLSNFFKH